MVGWPRSSKCLGILKTAALEQKGLRNGDGDDVDGDGGDDDDDDGDDDDDVDDGDDDDVDDDGGLHYLADYYASGHLDTAWRNARRVSI